MNKLASITQLHRLGLPTIYPHSIYGNDEKEIRAQVGLFYHYRKDGWVVRCAELPDIKGKMERGLPWAQDLYDKEDLIGKILELQKETMGKYVVFCHTAYNVSRGGTMLIDGDRVVIEAGEGNMKELSKMFRGMKNPDQSIVFKPGMISHESSGSDVLSLEDLFDMRNIERMLNWKDLGAIVDPVIVEFSRRTNNRLYVHDLAVV